MFKTLKDAKRRVVEKVLETVKASERTVDEDFDVHYAKFTKMITDTNEAGSGIHSLLTQQKAFFTDANEVAVNFSRIHDEYDAHDYWPGTTSKITTTKGAQLYKEKMDLIHNVYRASAALVNLEQALEPLRQTVAEIGPNVENTVKERNTIVIDLDSYRRRVKAAREKKVTLEQQGKGNTTAFADNETEIAKFEGKELAAKESYETKNEMAKEQIIEARARNDVVLSDAFITTVVCQFELYSRAAKELEIVMASLPQDKVKTIRNDLNGIINKGGPKVEKEADKTKLQKGFAIFTGKNVPSDFKKEDDATASPSAPPVAHATVLKSNSSNPFGGDDHAPPVVNSTPPPPPAPPAGGKKKVMVKALYDHVAEADDELNFSTNDMIEVVATSEDGWWKGKCHGKEGLFPVNYVDTSGI